MIARWPCPAAGLAGAGAGGTEEYALAFDRGRAHRLLLVPALLDEANRLRRFTVETMRRLDALGIDAILPDLPGTNESLAALPAQSLTTWRKAMAAAASHFRATHVLTLRGGTLVAPPGLPGQAHAPVGGASLLRQMLRSRILSSREAGREETSEVLLATGGEHGLVLAGHHLGPAMLGELQQAEPATALTPIAQSDLGGSALWLRAEPDADSGQSAALAQIIAAGLQC